MNLGFSQSAIHETSRPVEDLRTAIRRHTGLDYACVQRDWGWFLSPHFRTTPYRNSFIPEIFIAVSREEGRTILRITAQPVRSVRVFMGFWCGFALLIQMVLAVVAATGGTDTILEAFAPGIMCIGGYLLCKTAIQKTFLSVLHAIQKEFP